MDTSAEPSTFITKARKYESTKRAIAQARRLSPDHQITKNKGTPRPLRGTSIVGRDAALFFVLSYFRVFVILEPPREVGSGVRGRP
jgi:hypothetical protein